MWFKFKGYKFHGELLKPSWQGELSSEGRKKKNVLRVCKPTGRPQGKGPGRFPRGGQGRAEVFHSMSLGQPGCQLLTGFCGRCRGPTHCAQCQDAPGAAAVPYAMRHIRRDAQKFRGCSSVPISKQAAGEASESPNSEEAHAIHLNILNSRHTVSHQPRRCRAPSPAAIFRDKPAISSPTTG